MSDWWQNLTTLNQVFYAIAGFFSLLFIWQFIAAMFGMGDHGSADVQATDIDTGAGFTADQVEGQMAEHAADSVASFKILSVRAILAFCTMFSWAGSLYLNSGIAPLTAVTYALCWGVAGFIVTVLLVNWLRSLQEIGTGRLSSCVGGLGSVYLNIPAGGVGEVRVAVSGVVSHVRAMGAGGGTIPAGTSIKVLKLVDPTTIEVEPAPAASEGKEPASC